MILHCTVAITKVFFITMALLFTAAGDRVGEDTAATGSTSTSQLPLFGITSTVDVEIPPVFNETTTLPQSVFRLPVYAAALACAFTRGWLFPKLCVKTPSPTPWPSTEPTATTSMEPSVSSKPSWVPTGQPSSYPTISLFPSKFPSSKPTVSSLPTVSLVPSPAPSMEPSYFPTISLFPSKFPSSKPSVSSLPTVSLVPSPIPSMEPSVSNEPSRAPTGQPSSHPTVSLFPSKFPSSKPSVSSLPTVSLVPSPIPSMEPSVSNEPSRAPTGQPSSHPTVSFSPSNIPSTKPSVSMLPTISVKPSSIPSQSVSPSTSPVVFSQDELFPVENGLATNLTPQGPSRTPINLVCGNVKSVLTHPTNASLCFAAGINGGIWRTESCMDPSPLWIPLTDDEESLSVTEMVFDEDNPNVLVATIGRKLGGASGGPAIGLLRTTNAFAPKPEWTVLDNQAGSLSFRNAIFASVISRGNLMLAAGSFFFGSNANNATLQCSGGIWRSNNTGTTWNLVLPELLGLQVVSDPMDGDRFFAIIAGFPGLCSSSPGQGVFVSSDRGSNWVPTVKQPIAFSFGLNMKLSLASNGRVWVAAREPGNGQAVLAFSDNQGEAWTQLQSVPSSQSVEFLSLLASPDTDIVYYGGDVQPDNRFGALESTGLLLRGNASVPLSPLEHMTHSNAILSIPGGGTMNFSAPHPMSNDLALRADGSLVEGNAGGVAARTSPQDNLGDWFSLCGTGLQVFEVISVAYEPRRETVLFSTQSAGTVLGTLGVAGSYDIELSGPGNFVMIDFSSDIDNIYYYFGTFRLQEFYRLTLSLTSNTTTLVDISVNFQLDQSVERLVLVKSIHRTRRSSQLSLE